MAISRMQMYRQLRAGGGIMSITPRENFGLGSSLKKFVRKVIPNEVSDIAVKAAPFVAPFNPLLAGSMAAIGGFDQTGSIGRSIKSGLLTYGGGQLARYAGGAGFQKGFNPFQGADFSGGILSGIRSLGSSPIGTQTGLRLGQYEMFGGQPPDITSQNMSLATGDATAAETVYGVNPNAVGTADGITNYTLTAAEKADQAKKIANASKGLIPERGYVDILKDVNPFTGDLSKTTKAITELGGKALKDVFTKPVRNAAGEVVGSELDKSAAFAAIAGATSYLEAKKLAADAELVEDPDEYTEDMYEADKQRYYDKYSQVLTPEAFGIRTESANGGRIGFAYGTEPEGIPSITLTEEGDDEDYTQVADLNKNRISQLLGLLESETIDDDYRIQIQQEIDQLMGKFATGGRVGLKDGNDFKKMKSPVISINPLDDAMNKAAGLDEELEGPGGLGALGLMQLMKKGVPNFTSKEKTLVIRNLAGRSRGTPEYKELGKSIPEVKRIMDNPQKYLKDATILKEYVKVLMGKKDGGRIGYAMGSPEQNAVAASQASGIPLNTNPAGATELDMRNTGGFVPPVGVKEKADDIPAMLSNNEFVFTADAVRAAGGGSVNKGAQKMYALMKQLEGKMA